MPVPHKIARVAACLLAFVPLAAPAHASPTKDEADVRQLMADDHAAVVAHDGPRLARLFVPSGSDWFNVLSDAGYARVAAKNPSVPKIRTSTVASFIGFVTGSKARLDPQHGTVRIQTDGAIASACFDFRSLIDGKVENQGIESWQLVKSADGWRIASIVYSSAPGSAT